MTSWFWVIVFVVGIALASSVIARLNRRTCLLAFGKGFTDAHSTSWKEIEQQYRSYLKPMRPMDAASYKRGIEYCLMSKKEGTWQDLKRDFTDVWKSGAVTREGTSIRTMGAEVAGKELKLRIPEKFELLIKSNPEFPPLAAKVQLEGTST